MHVSFGSDVHKILNRDGWLYNGVGFLKVSKNGPLFYNGLSPRFLKGIAQLRVSAGGRENKRINAFKVLKGTSHSNVHAAADIIDVESIGSCSPMDSAPAADAEVTLSIILEDVGVSREDQPLPIFSL